MVQIIAVRVTTAKSSCMKNRKVEATEALTEAKTSQGLEGSGDIKGGTDICDKTSRASVAQLVRARDCQSLGRRFDSG